MKYDLSPVTVLCPVCENTESELLYEVDSAGAAQHLALKETNPTKHKRLRSAIERLWQRESASLVRCCICGFIFADPFTPGDAEFYSLFYDTPSFPKWKWEYSRALQFLQQQSNNESPDGAKSLRVLEIGAGTGMFVEKVAGHISEKENIVTLEYSEAGQAAIRRLGVDSLGEDLLTVPGSRIGQFDAICMFQVLEHMDRLHSVFSKLAELSKSGALLIVAVPGDNMMTHYEECDAWLDYPPVHVSRWNRDAFERIGPAHGWSLKAYEYEPTSFIWKYLQFCLYKHVYRAEKAGTFRHWIETRKNRFVKKVLQAFAVGCTAFVSLPQLTSFQPRNMGHVQLAVFEQSNL